MFARRSEAQSAPEPALSPAEWRSFKVTKVEQLTKTANPTVFVRLAFDDPKAKAGYHVASCLMVRAPITKEDGTPGFAMRPYTPISLPSAEGHLDLAVKVYKTTPKPGVLGSYFEGLKVGDSVDVKGPFAKIPLEKVAALDKAGFVAGGSGITPVLQVLEALTEVGASTKATLLFANTSEDEILLRDRIDALVKANPNLSVHYLIDKPAEGWTGGVGYVTSELIAEKLPGPKENAMIFVCGPPPMMNAISGNKAGKEQGELDGYLKELGWTKDQVFKF